MEAALARVIEPGAPESAAKRRVQDWLPQLQRWDEEFVELPWEAKQLLFTFSEPNDIRALCSASRLFNDYCRSSQLDDYWKRKIANLLELQRVREAGRVFKRANLSWTRDWVLLKPIAQWTLDDFDSLWAENWEPSIMGELPPAAPSWFHAWLFTERVATLFPRIPVTSFPEYFAKTSELETQALMAQMGPGEAEPSLYHPIESLRVLFLRAKVLLEEGQVSPSDRMIFILSEWNFRDPALGRPTEFSPGEDSLHVTYYNSTKSYKVDFLYPYSREAMAARVSKFDRFDWSLVSAKPFFLPGERYDAALVNPSRFLGPETLVLFRN